ncbi:hypothetical protein ABN48_02320 [Haemophilus influenzae]|nr:hypothetical protein ABN48_02320 [Haemophilus influenzae]
MDGSYFERHYKRKIENRQCCKSSHMWFAKITGKVFTFVVENTKSDTLILVIIKKIKLDSWGCMIFGCNYYTLTKKVLRKYNEIHRKHFSLFLNNVSFSLTLVHQKNC